MTYLEFLHKKEWHVPTGGVRTLLIDSRKYVMTLVEMKHTI